MSKEFVSCLLHVVFGTQHLKKFLTADVREHLHNYMISIAKSKGMRIIALGGTENHLHFILAIPAKMSIETAIHPLKQSSAIWLRQNFDPLKSFAWAEGFGAFSISRSQIDSVMLYLKNQENYHQKRGFEEEYKEFLRFHNMTYNELTLFDG